MNAMLQVSGASYLYAFVLWEGGEGGFVLSCTDVTTEHMPRKCFVPWISTLLAV